jgi:small-conductance mechanosensitive channel
MVVSSGAAPTAPLHAAAPLAAERLIKAARDIWRELVRLDPQIAGLNLLLSLLVVAAALLAVKGLRRLFDWALGRFMTHADGGREPETPRVAGLTWLLLRLTITGGAIVATAGIWGVDLFAVFAGGVGAAILRAVGVLVLAVAAVEIAGFVVERLVEGFARRSGDTTRRAAQIRTLGPLINGLIKSVVIVISVLTFLSEIGVKIGPLLASAGVVGVAIGFGAQTLVKDFLTGLFLIAEDVVSVGDNVLIGDAGGTVEAMTLRTIRLRDLNGTLHIFPYSEAQVIHNRTSTFSSFVFETMTTYDSDTDLALKIMGEVGEEMRRDPQYATKITRPFEVLGVDRLDALGVVVKGRITTRPREQWAVGREYNLRIKLAFERAGVQLAYRPAGAPAPTVATAPSGATEPRSFGSSVDHPST